MMQQSPFLLSLRTAHDPDASDCVRLLPLAPKSPAGGVMSRGTIPCLRSPGSARDRSSGGDRGYRLHQASPASADDLRGLAPALVVWAECDVLRDEAEAYALRLAAAGVPVERHRLDGQAHSFLRHVGVLASSDEVLEEIAAGIGRLLALGGGNG